MRISDWSSDVCSSDLLEAAGARVVGIDLRDAEIEADLADAGQVESIGRRLVELDLSVIDGVATCAGVSGGKGDSQMIVALNFFGTVAVIEQMHPFLPKAQEGRVVAFASSYMLGQTTFL